MKKIIFSFIVLLSVIACHSQSVNRISTPCKTPYTGTIGSIQATTAGDLTYTPCTTRTSLFNGNVDFSNATVTGLSGSGFISGTGTATFVPRFTSASVLGNTPLSWNGTQYDFQNTALNSNFIFQFLPSSAGGIFKFGDFTTTLTGFDMEQVSGITSLYSATELTLGSPLTFVGKPLAQIQLTTSTGTIDLASTKLTIGTDSLANIDINSASADQVRIGATTSTNGGQFSTGANFNFWTVPSTFNLQLGASGGGANARFDLNRSTQTATLFTNTFDWSAFTTSLNLLRTVTAGGTTGNQTINQMAGSVNFAAAGTDITVTNSTVTANSLIFCTVQTNDATAVSCRVTDKAAGSFHLRIPAATAETQVAFWVTN